MVSLFGNSVIGSDIFSLKKIGLAVWRDKNGERKGIIFLGLKKWRSIWYQKAGLAKKTVSLRG